ncbi:MAG: hypothetical protein MJK18_14000, partial [Bdellovibrionales bacterium]|nr:hypothetical protein [Bdellovibrionales bacterium]
MSKALICFFIFIPALAFADPHRRPPTAPTNGNPRCSSTGALNQSYCTVDRLAETYNVTEADLEEVNTRLTALSETVTRHASDIRQNRAQIVESETELTSITGRRDEVITQFEQTQVEYDQLTLQAQNLRATQQDYLGIGDFTQAEAIEGQVATINSDLHWRSLGLMRMSSIIGDLDGQIATTEGQLETLRANLESRQAEALRLNQRWEELTTRRDELQETQTVVQDQRQRVEEVVRQIEGPTTAESPRAPGQAQNPNNTAGGGGQPYFTPVAPGEGSLQTSGGTDL